MQRNAVPIVVFAATAAIVIAVPVLSVLRSSPIAQVAIPENNVIRPEMEGMDFVRIPEESNSEFCSMKRGGAGLCKPSTITCAKGWKKICQGTCACGGSICQCVDEEVASESNVCGNKTCEPGEFRTKTATCPAASPSCTPKKQIIPECNDCLALARSGTKESVCFDEALEECIATSPNGGKNNEECIQKAERVCGSTGEPESCSHKDFAICMNEKIAQKTSPQDARALCEDQVCPSSAQSSSSSSSEETDMLRGCTAEEFASCVDQQLTKRPEPSDPQGECRKICAQIQKDHSYLSTLENKVKNCDFVSLGRCCQIEKVIHPNIPAEVCFSACAKKPNLPEGNVSACN